MTGLQYWWTGWLWALLSFPTGEKAPEAFFGGADTSPKQLTIKQTNSSDSDGFTLCQTAEQKGKDLHTNPLRCSTGSYPGPWGCLGGGGS